MNSTFSSLMNWLGNNTVAIQAFSSIAICQLTLGLVFVTGWYVYLNCRIARAMEKQTVASFQPMVRLVFGNSARVVVYNGGGSKQHSICGSVKQWVTMAHSH